MSGGKETPRQKMIGMMYLVLTALLALNVSASIMEKFAALNISMEHATMESEKRITAKVGDIEASVIERGNKGNDAKVLKNAKAVKAETKKIIDYIQALKTELIGENVPEEGSVMPTNAKDNETTNIVMLGAAKDGKAYDLEKMLNAYISNVNKIKKEIGDKKMLEKLALSGAEDPITKDDPSHAGYDFAQVNFEETPVIAALAVLSNFQSKVSTIEGEIIASLAGQVGASDHKLGELFPIVKPVSQVVAAGTYYEAEMFLTGTITGLENPVMKFGGKEITVEGGKGKVKFKATGGKYDKEGKIKKSWKGTIIVKDPLTGEDDPKEITEEYFVANPVLQVQSASVQALYLNCGNDLQINCPALGTEYDPKFRAAGGSASAGKKKGQVTIVPTTPNVTLSVSSGGTKIDDLKFKVRKIPKPEIVALAGNKPVDEKRGMKAPGPRSIKMKAVADESFKTFLPKDARYKVTSWEATLVRGKRPVDKKTFTSGTGNLSSFAAKAKPGDRILIEVKKVMRLNFRGKKETVKVGLVLKNIPLTD